MEGILNSQLFKQKILYITSRDSDYLQDLIYSGLLSKLSPHQIIDFPWKWSFHFPRKVYPRNLGLQENWAKSFIKDAFINQKFQNSPDWSEIGLVVLAAAKPDAFRTFISIKDQIPAQAPIVFLDGGDLPEVGGDLYRLKCPDLLTEATQSRPFDFIFKREKILNKDYASNVVALPFPVPFLKIPPYSFQDSKRIYDVTFWAVESDPVRTKALELIENKFDCKQNGTTRNQIFKKYKRKGLFYLEELARSKVILNFRGVGWDTLRYWEVFGLSRFLISQKPQIEIPNNFTEGSEIVFCKDDLSDLVELCDYYLKNEDIREKIAINGNKKAKQYHSEEARVDYVFDHLKKAEII